MARKSKLWKSSGVAAAKTSDEKEHRKKAKALREERVARGRMNDLQEKRVPWASSISKLRKSIARDLAMHNFLSGNRGMSLASMQSKMRGPFSGIPKGELFTIDGCPSPMTVRTKAGGIAKLNAQLGEPQGLVDGEDLVVHSAPNPLFPHSRQEGIQWVDMELNLDEFIRFMATKTNRNIDSAVTALEDLRSRKSVAQNGNDLSITLTEFWEKDSTHGLPTRLLGTYIPEKDAVLCRLTTPESDYVVRMKSAVSAMQTAKLSDEELVRTLDPTRTTNLKDV